MESATSNERARSRRGQLLRVKFLPLSSEKYVARLDDETRDAFVAASVGV
jgi:hypothetical protein